MNYCSSIMTHLKLSPQIPKCIEPTLAIVSEALLKSVDSQFDSCYDHPPCPNQTPYSPCLCCCCSCPLQTTKTRKITSELQESRQHTDHRGTWLNSMQFDLLARISIEIFGKKLCLLTKPLSPPLLKESKCEKGQRKKGVWSSFIEREQRDKKRKGEREREWQKNNKIHNFIMNSVL